MSNLTPRGTIKGVIRSGGGGGVTDYDQLNGRPLINSNLVTGNKNGHEYGLLNNGDIDVTKIYLLDHGFNYNLTLKGENVHITDQTFTPATSRADGASGLVPRPSAGDTGKILSNEGWIENPEGYKPPDYSTTEQKTGQKGLNGEDIYFQTFTGTTTTQIVFGANIKEVYGVNGYIAKDGYKYIAPFNDGSDKITIAITPTNEVRIVSSNYFSGGSYLFTIFYTKN